MKVKQLFLVFIILSATVFQFYGLLRYNSRLPDDLLGHLLYIVSIICLLTALAIVLIRNKRIKL